MTGAASVHNGVWVYRLRDSFSRLLYVGVAKSVEARIQSHRRKQWGIMIARSELRWFPTRAAALHAEANAIYVEEPLFNRAGREGLPDTAREVLIKFWEDADPSAWVVDDREWTPTRTVKVRLYHPIFGGQKLVVMADSLEEGESSARASLTETAREWIDLARQEALA